MMTGIWFDTCLRLKKTLKLMLDIFGNRKISIARELTKTHEEVIFSDLMRITEIINKREENKNPLKGEVVLILEGHNKKKEVDFKTLTSSIEIS